MLPIYRILFLLCVILLEIPSVRAETIEGILSADMIFYKDGRENLHYSVLTKNGARIGLSAKSRLKSKLEQLRGHTVKVTLAKRLGKIDNRIITLRPLNRDIRVDRALPEMHRVVFILVKIDELEPVANLESLKTLITQGDSPRSSSLVDIFEKSSRKLLRLSVVSRKNKFNAFGPVAVSRLPGESCDNSYLSWSARALAQIQNFPTKSFEHLVYIFPESDLLGCSFVGRGELFGTTSWIFRASPNSIAHELGHNLGFFHAGRFSKSGDDKYYGDKSSPMGKFHSSAILYNAANIVQRGWMNKSSPNFRQLSAPFSEEIAIVPLESPNLTKNQYQILHFAPSKNLAPYVFSFRAPQLTSSIELDEEYAQGASIHRDYGLGQSTDFLGALRDGESFIDSRFGLKVTQMRHSQSQVVLKIAITSPARINDEKTCYFVDPCSTQGRQPSARTCGGHPLYLEQTQIPKKDFCPP